MTQVSDMSTSHVQKEMQNQGLTTQIPSAVVAELHKNSHAPPFSSLDTLSAVSASFSASAVVAAQEGQEAEAISSGGEQTSSAAATGSTQRQTIGTDETSGERTQAPLPPPLKLPKRFSVANTDTEYKTEPPQENPGSMPAANGSQFPGRQQYFANPVTQGFPSADYLQCPLQQVRPMQPYQHTFYNTQTGTLVTLPMSAPPYPYANVAVAPQVQQPVLLMPVRQQTYYTRAANGQLVPVAVPALSTVPAMANVNLGSSGNPQLSQQTTTAAGAVSAAAAAAEDKSARKKQKTSKSAAPSILKAEQLQRQHIQRQTMLYPNLHQQVQSPNVSDIYQTNDDSANSVVSGEENYEDGVGENGVKMEMVNTAETSPAMGNTPIMLTGQEAVEKQPKLQKITGTVTLGAFTYKYSQTLSGDPTKDRELFDCLTDNAWKSCMAKR